MLSEKAKTVFNFVKESTLDDNNITAYDIEEGTGIGVKAVNAIITRAFQMHKDKDGEPMPLMERIPAEIELEDGTHKPIKLIRLTELGMEFDPDEEEG